MGGLGCPVWILKAAAEGGAMAWIEGVAQLVDSGKGRYWATGYGDSTTGMRARVCEAHQFTWAAAQWMPFLCTTRLDMRLAGAPCVCTCGTSTHGVDTTERARTDFGPWAENFCDAFMWRAQAEGRGLLLLACVASQLGVAAGQRVGYRPQCCCLALHCATARGSDTVWILGLDVGRPSQARRIGAGSDRLGSGGAGVRGQGQEIERFCWALDRRQQSRMPRHHRQWCTSCTVRGGISACMKQEARLQRLLEAVAATRSRRGSWAGSWQAGNCNAWRLCPCTGTMQHCCCRCFVMHACALAQVSC